MFLDNPLFKTLEEWDTPDTDGPDMHEKHREHRARALRCWEFLRPFFASRGFTLYDLGPHHNNIYPPVDIQLDPTLTGIDDYPYGRRFYKTREDGAFYIHPCWRIWAAQDKLWRDVVIKLVPEDELKVLRYLNTNERRADPRNHTIPLIDSGTVSGIPFAITPRWDCTFRFAFETVAEIMQFTQAMLEGLDFMHENRVFHGDVLEQNTGMNVSLHLPYDGKPPPGLREPSRTRYAYYDFETSAIYPLELPLDEVYRTEYQGFGLRRIPQPTGPFKIFPLEVLCLGLVLERVMKKVVIVVNELKPFLAGMVNVDVEERFTARQASMEFATIYAKLTPEQLAHRLIR